ncbi:MAG: hypothetical protein ACREGH_03650, partial [Minisyncoccia bacterium]
YIVLVYTGTYNSQTFLAQGELTVTGANSTPVPPIASCPTSGSACSISWSSVPGATGYEVALQTFASAVCPSGWTDMGVLSSDGNRDCHYGPISSTSISPALTPGQAYWAFVAAQVNGTWTAFSAASPSFVASSVPSSLSCTISASPSQPYVNGEYELSWTWNGADPFAANNSNNTGVIDISRSFGPGIILANPAAEPYELWDTQPNTDTATLGVGSIYSSSAFTPVCSVNIPVISDGASGGSITSSSLLQRPNQSFTIAGTDSYGDGSRNVFVDVIPATYSGSRSWSAIQNVFPATTYYADVVNGTWTAPYEGGMAEGEYTVLVYDVSSTPRLIASGLLDVTNKG